MNHLEASFKGRNSIWRYVALIFIILLISNTIGSIPLLIALFTASAGNPDVFAQFSANPGDTGILNVDPYTGLIIMLFPFIAGLAAFVMMVKVFNYRSIRMTVNGTEKIRWSHFFISALVWLLLSMVYLFVYLRIDPANFTLNNKTISLLFISVIAILLIPFQAAYEEVIFRGYLMQGFSVIFNYRWFPLIITSVLFGLMHSFNPEVKEYGFYTVMPQYILFGLIFGIITILDDGIEAAVGAHAANNIFLVIMVTQKASALQTPALYMQNEIDPLADLVALLLLGILSIFILKIIFRWKDFSVLSGKISRPVEDQIS